MRAMKSGELDHVPVSVICLGRSNYLSRKGTLESAAG